MPYFDSAKNKAIWNRELTLLKEERMARAEGKAGRAFHTANDPGAGVNENGELLIERVTFEQLMQEEREASGRAASHEPALTAALSEPSLSREAALPSGPEM